MMIAVKRLELRLTCAYLYIGTVYVCTYLVLLCGLSARKEDNKDHHIAGNFCEVQISPKRRNKNHENLNT